VFAELLTEKLAGIAILAPGQLAQLEAHYELLKKWNQSLNLTRIEELADAVKRHYCESIFLAAHLPEGPFSIADIGSGGGFPGIPVAILRPDCPVTLIESHQRKAVFLREASRSLPNIRVVPQRAEEIKERFDHVISRAVSYEDLIKPLKKLATQADLLTGGEGPPAKMGFAWDSPIALPWGTSRFLRIGRRASV
jgi:16S rRNA (guanine527-N7)-methyltransferase